MALQVLRGSGGRVQAHLLCMAVDMAGQEHTVRGHVAAAALVGARAHGRQCVAAAPGACGLRCMACGTFRVQSRFGMHMPSRPAAPCQNLGLGAEDRSCACPSLLRYRATLVSSSHLYVRPCMLQVRA